MPRSRKAQAAIDDALSLTVANEQVGLGIDLVDIARMRKILDRTPSFKERYFTEEEREFCDARKGDKAPHYAARFAAKEAVVKALGTGFSNGIQPKDISIERQPGKRPYARLHGVAKQVADEQMILEIPISLSHTSSDAIACAIAIKSGTTVEDVAQANPAAELSKRFKEMRTMLDSLPATTAKAEDSRSVDDDDREGEISEEAHRDTTLFTMDMQD